MDAIWFLKTSSILCQKCWDTITFLLLHKGILLKIFLLLHPAKRCCGSPQRHFPMKQHSFGEGGGGGGLVYGNAKAKLVVGFELV